MKGKRNEANSCPLIQQTLKVTNSGQNTSSLSKSPSGYTKASPGRRRSTRNSVMLTEQLLEDAAEMLRSHVFLEQAAASSMCNAIRMVPLLRLANLVILICLGCLIAVGTTTYHTPKGEDIILHISIHNWKGKNPLMKKIENFDLLSVNGQYFAFVASIILTVETLLLLAARVMGWWPSRMVSMVYAFGAVPVLLVIFALEIYYSTCPWLEEFYNKKIRTEGTLDVNLDVKCTVNGWAAAAGMAVISAGICITDGLLACFMRPADIGDLEHGDL